MTILEIMGRVARAKDRTSMGQKHTAEFWQWLVGREKVGDHFPSSLDTAIQNLEQSLHDLRLIKAELELKRK